MMMTLAPEEAAREISTICFCATLSDETRAAGSIDGSIAFNVETTRSVQIGSDQKPEAAALHAQREVLQDA